MNIIDVSLESDTECKKRKLPIVRLLLFATKFQIFLNDWCLADRF